MTQNVQGTFVSEKLNKIRWRPDIFDVCRSFISASWDNDINTIKLWNFRESEDDPNVYPYVVSEYLFSGDVTEAKFLNADYLVASSSLGDVKLLKIDVDISGAYKIIDEIVWNRIHHFPTDSSSCTSFAVYDNDIVTVGEDGRINLLTAQRKNIVRFIENADSCTLNCVTFLKHNEILSSNCRGQMKLWDLRSEKNTPSSTFMLSGDQVMPTCLVYHPTQRHLLVAGDEEGSLTVWDLRQNTFPVNLLSAHTDSVSEILFHPSHPDQLFSCSNAGEVWHWMSPVKHSSTPSMDIEGTPLFLVENVKNSLEVYALMPKLHKPINSIDVNGNKVLCGCDNEAIYLINDVSLFA